jgi:transcriptional regulator with XRE-family HTH domain
MVASGDGATMTLTGAQVKEARKLLGWTQPRIAGELGIGVSQIASFEAGKSQLSVLQTSVLKRVLEAGGVEFIAEHGAAGVRLRKTG